MPNTLQFIGKTVLTSNQSQITFTGIPSTYTDLVFYVANRQTTAQAGTVSQNMQTWFNNSQTAAYYSQSIFTSAPSSGSAVIAFQASAANNFDHMYSQGSGATSDTFTNTMIYVFNYASSGNKMVITQAAGENNAQTAFVHGFVGRWTVSSAVDRIDFDPDQAGQNMVSGSSIYVYGISNS